MRVIAAVTDESIHVIGVIRREARVGPTRIWVSVRAVAKGSDTLLRREKTTLLECHLLLTGVVVISTRETTLMPDDDITLLKIHAPIIEFHAGFGTSTDVIV